MTTVKRILLSIVERHKIEAYNKVWGFLILFSLVFSAGTEVFVMFDELLHGNIYGGNFIGAVVLHWLGCLVVIEVIELIIAIVIDYFENRKF